MSMGYHYLLVQTGQDALLGALKKEVEAKGLAKDISLISQDGLPCSGATVALYPERLFYGDLKEEDAPSLIEGIASNKLLENKPLEGKRLNFPLQPEKRILLENVGSIDPEKIEEYLERDGYSALKRALSLIPEEVIEEVKKSGLKGRGGAGFPAGLKWESARKEKNEPKYIICNADEGEPGTFKDRLILEGDPHRIIEGITIAAYASGAKRGFIYIRGEYALSIRRMRKAILDAKRHGFLGENILGSGFSFELEVKEGAGGYVVGDETALMESVEGKRGNPRIKPPYPTTVGVFSKPTVINNVETLANVPAIIKNGAQWYRTMGTQNSPGTKIYLVIGDVNSPAAVELDMGTPLTELIFGYGQGIKDGLKFKSALLGGAAGVFVGQDLLGVHMDYESLKKVNAVLGSGSVLVLSERASLPDVLYSVLKFFRHESCGQCTPCRSGTRELCRLMEKVQEGRGSEDDLKTMVWLSQVLWSASLCPLGQSLIMPVKSAIEGFPEEFSPLFNLEEVKL